MEKHMLGLLLADKGKIEEAFNLETDKDKLRAQFEPSAFSLALMEMLHSKGLINSTEIFDIYALQKKLANALAGLTYHALYLAMYVENEELFDDSPEDLLNHAEEVVECGQELLDMQALHPDNRVEFREQIQAAEGVVKEIKAELQKKQGVPPPQGQQG